MAFFLTRVGASYGYSYRAEARYTKRCRAPFSDLGDPKKTIAALILLTR